MKTSLFPGYVLDDTLDDDTPYVDNGDNGINDNNDNENYNYDNNDNNNVNDLNDNNDDDNDNNYDNDNGDQTVMIFQARHFVKLFICEKAELLAFTHICAHR